MFEEAYGVAKDLQVRMTQSKDDLEELQKTFRTLSSCMYFKDMCNLLKYLAKTKTDAASLRTQISVIQNEVAYISNIDAVNVLAGFDPESVRKMAVGLTMDTERFLENVEKYIHDMEVGLGLVNKEKEDIK